MTNPSRTNIGHEAFKRYILDKREEHLRAIERKPFSYVPPLWGTGGQYNGATITLMKSIESDILGDSSDGINPCGYEELTPYLLSNEDFIRDEDTNNG